MSPSTNISKLRRGRRPLAKGFVLALVLSLLCLPSLSLHACLNSGRVSFDDPMDAQLERPCCVKNQQLKASNSNSENNAAITCCTSIQLSKGQFIASKSEEEWSQNLEIETIHAAHGSRPLELPHPNHGLLRGSLRANAPPPPPKTALQLRAELCIRNT